MNNPLMSDEKAKPAAKKSDGLSRGPAPATVKLNPKNFDWFMAGIDKERIQSILENVKENPALD
jgi:hypothetical protein